MAYSIQTAVSNGTLEVLDLSIKYMDKSHIFVYVDDVLVDGSAYSYVWLTNNRIQVVPAVANGSTLKVIRKTLTDEMWHEFSKGARFSTTSMDDNFEQLLFLAQEYSEGIYVSDFYTDVDIHLKRILNLGDPLNDGDAVNLKTLKEYLPNADLLPALTQRIAAEEAKSAKISTQGITVANKVINNFDATGLQDGAWIHCAGRDTIGDGGGGMFRYSAASTQTADGGLVFAPAGGGRLLRDGWTVLGFNGRINAQWFGAYPGGVTDCWQPIMNAFKAANPNVWNASYDWQQGGGVVYLPKGVYRITKGIQRPPFVMFEGDGPDGWTGGGAGIGITSSNSKPNGTAIWADFTGTDINSAAIDTQNWKSDGTLNPTTNLTPIPTSQFLNGTYKWCQGGGLRNIDVFSLNQAAVGIRNQGAALSVMENVSSIGFRTAGITNSSWCFKHERLFYLGYQVGNALLSCNAYQVDGVFDCYGWGTSNGTTITNNNVVTASNKPAFWSANDTNYNSTSLYIVGGYNCNIPNATAQHCGRPLYAEDADVSIGTLYIEDLPYLTTVRGTTAGSINAYNATAGNRSIVINHLHCDANGATLFNNITNTPITLLNFSGIQGMTYGAAGTGKLLLGNNVNRNGAFGDYLFDTRIEWIGNLTGTFTPGPNNITGTISTITGKWVQRGNVFDVTIDIAGTSLAAVGGGASFLTTAFNAGALPQPARRSAVSITTSNLQAVGAGYAQEATDRVYIPAITSTTRITLNYTVFAD